MPKGEKGFLAPKAAPLTKQAVGYFASLKGTILSGVHGNAEHFYEVTVPAMGMVAEDFPHFKGTDSHTVSGWVDFPTPHYIVNPTVLDGWEHVNLGNGKSRINSIDLVIALAKEFGIKPSFPQDLKAAHESVNHAFSFGD